MSTGFNRALSESKGNIILRVDGHTNLEKDFLANCLEVMAKKDVENIRFAGKLVELRVRL